MDFHSETALQCVICHIREIGIPDFRNYCNIWTNNGHCLLKFPYKLFIISSHKVTYNVTEENAHNFGYCSNDCNHGWIILDADTTCLCRRR